MEKTQLLIFANIAAITYEDPKTAKTKFKAIGYNIIEFFDINNAQAYLLKDNEGTHVLSFRGTEVTEPSDILADLKAGKNIEAIVGNRRYIIRCPNSYCACAIKVYPSLCRTLYCVSCRSAISAVW